MALDFDGTLAAISEASDRRIAEATALANAADRSAIQAEDGRRRADRALLEGKLDDKDYRRLLDTTGSECEAARASKAEPATVIV